MALRPAKITVPRVPVAIPRPRLWSRLDAAARAGGAIWISGAPGSGKTTLVASWLAARRRRAVWVRLDPMDADLGTFLHYLAAAARLRARDRMRLPALAPGLDPEAVARRHFRALLPRLPKETLLVLDDAAEVPDESPLWLATRVLLEELPRGVAALFLSRGAPPPALSRARAQQALSVLSPKALELSSAETWSLARLRGFRGSRAEAKELHDAVHGWAAGLVLLLGSERRGRVPVEAATVDYFAGEVLARADARARRVLLEAALLEAPTASLVARATGDAAAPRVLSSLARRGLFVLSHGGEDPAFELHALFRAFLLRRGRDELPPGRAGEVRRTAARALSERGGADAEAAFALLVEAGSFDEAASLAAREAPGLVESGRGETLQAWLARLPAERRDADPWLLYHGAVADLVRAPDSARERLERAAAGFTERGDAAGVWLAWAAAVDATIAAGTDFNPLSRRVADLGDLRARFPFPSPRIEQRVTLATLAALVQHAPGHPAVRDALAAARAIALGPGDDRTRLAAGTWYHMHTGWWLGDVEAVRPVVEALRSRARAPGADPLTATFWLAAEAPFRFLQGDEAAAARVAEEARAHADRLGVRACDAVLLTQEIWAALARDDVNGARALVAALRGRIRTGVATDLGVLHTFDSLVALRSGALDDAIGLAARAKELGERTGYPTVHVSAEIVLARAHAKAGPGHSDRAEAAFAAAREKVRTIGSPPFEHVLSLAEADRALGEGRTDEARRALARAIPGARAGVLHARYLFSREDLARLWALALRSGISPEEVRGVLRMRELPPPPDAGEEWPWQVRIRALGRFEVERDGSPVVGAKGAMRRPLELLRLLVAFGGRDVEEGLVADALWPDAEADAAHHALETTLYRLRRIVGPGVVSQRDRRLSIERERCWVDALELEACLGAGLAALERRAGGRGEEAARIAALYRGPLLADAPEAAWAADARDRLRRRLARWLEALERVAPKGEAAALGAKLAAVDPALEPGPVLRLA